MIPLIFTFPDKGHSSFKNICWETTMFSHCAREYEEKENRFFLFYVWKPICHNRV